MSEALSWGWSLVPAAVVAVVAVAARLTQGSWLAPGASWAGFWAGAVWLPLLFAHTYPVAPAAIWFIAAFVVVLNSFAFLAQQCCKRLPAGPPVVLSPKTISALSKLCVVGGCAGVAAGMMTLQQYGGSWRTLLKFDELVDLAQAITVARYTGTGEGTSIPIQLALVLQYVAALAGGQAMAWREGWKRNWILTLPIWSGLLYATITTAKAAFLYTLILWIASFASNLTRRRGRGVKIPVRYVWRGGVIVCLIALFFVGGLIMRYGTAEANNRERLVGGLKVYVLAHLSAYSGWWVSLERDDAPLQWGKASFFGPAAYVMKVERKSGVYADQNTEFGEGSNIFTIYRGLIEDFSVAGALALAAIGGFASSLLYYRLLHRRSSVLTPVAVTLFYALLLWSHIINLIGYTTIFLAFAVYGATVLCLRHVNFSFSNRRPRPHAIESAVPADPISTQTCRTPPATGRASSADAVEA